MQFVRPEPGGRKRDFGETAGVAVFAVVAARTEHEYIGTWISFDGEAFG